MEFYKTVSRYFKQCKIRASANFIRERMESHPGYPTLISLIDILTELNLEYSAILCEKGRYRELRYPLLAHVSMNGEENFVQIKSSSVFSFTNRLFDNWDGIVVYIEPKSSINHKEHNNYLTKEDKKKRFQLLTLTIFLSLICFLSILLNSVLLIVILIFSILGAAFCTSVILRNIGKADYFFDKLCNSEGSGCDSLLQSRSFSSSTINLGDFGFVYFITMCLFIALSGNFSINLLLITSFLKIPIGLGLLIVCASVFYQWVVAKTWCRLCLLIDAVLCIQAAFLFSPMSNTLIVFNNRVAMLFVLTFVLTSIVWYWYKQMLIEAEQKKKNEFVEKRFKRDPELFISVLEKQRRVNTDSWEDDIFLGNRKASIQLIVVCNPYCIPCAKMHKVIEELIRYLPTEIGATIRFAIRTDDPNEKRLIAVSHILSAWLMGYKNALDEWFKHMSLPEFLVKFPHSRNDEVINPLLELHETWAKNSKITHTPAIFINGWQLPKQYKFSDIAAMMIQLSEYVSVSSKEVHLGKDS